MNERIEQCKNCLFEIGDFDPNNNIESYEYACDLGLNPYSQYYCEDCQERN